MTERDFISSKDDNDEERVIHSKRGNIEIMLNDEVDKVTERFFKSLMKIHQNKLEESMKGSEFVIDNVHLLYCKYRKINLSCVGL